MKPPTRSAQTEERLAWNQAHDRTFHFLNAFAIEDRSHLFRMVLDLLKQAREKQRQNPEIDPTSLAIGLTRQEIASWLAANLGESEDSPSEVLRKGYVALLLSPMFRGDSSIFLRSQLPPDFQSSLRHALLVTGPDLDVSSMTPRPLDYGPMLGLARETWHRWDKKTVVTALLLWSGIYLVLYEWLSQFL